jgi:hypothetical protein
MDALYIKTKLIEARIAGADFSTISPLIWARYYAKAMGVAWKDSWDDGLRARKSKKTKVGKTPSSKKTARAHKFAKDLIAMIDAVSAAPKPSVQ